MTQKGYYALGIRRSRQSIVLDVTYPEIITITEPIHVSENQFILLRDLDETIIDITCSKYKEMIKNIQVSEERYSKCEPGIFYLKAGDQPVQSAEEAYFKLQCLSQRIATPHSLNLDGLFGMLTNIVWTNKGPILPDDIQHERLRYMATSEPLLVTHVDKFPYMLDYHVPSGIRVASGSQVRLGAYLGEGTTVMPAGYINFNAGTTGHAMVEGRVSAGVVVGNNSDIGGGASIMGTLSGGNKDIISIGQECLLGANAGAGISLGNGCTVAAGLYIYSGMKVSLYNEDNEPINLKGNVVDESRNVVKAKELSGKDNLLFIQDSRTGKVLCKPNKKAIELNSQLHKND